MEAVSVAGIDAEDQADRIRVYRPVIKLIMLLAFGIPLLAALSRNFHNDLTAVLPVCAPLFLFALVLLAILTFRSGPDSLQVLDRLYAFMFFMLFFFAAMLMLLGNWQMANLAYLGPVRTLVLARMVTPVVLCLVICIAFRVRFRWVRWLVAAFVLWTCVVAHLWILEPNQPGSTQAAAQAQTTQNARTRMDAVRRERLSRLVTIEEMRVFYPVSFPSPFWRAELRDFPHFLFCALVLVYSFYVRRRLLAKAERAG